MGLESLNSTRRRVLFTLPALPLLAALSGCVAGGSHRVEQYGTMREVLRDGETHARVALSDVTAKPNAYAVGAVSGLEGEILVLDGVVWVATADDAGGQVTRNVPADRCEATLLAAAHVGGWDEVRIEQPVSPETFEAFVREEIVAAGFGAGENVPFLVEGELLDAKLHVVNRVCPMQAANSESVRKPYHGSRARAAGTLFGFYAPKAAGVLTHHGSKIHAHALFAGEEPLMGHVDSVGVSAGATIRFPKR